MKTSSFRTFRGPGGVSIARSCRGFHGPAYRELAPGSWFKSASNEEYLIKYAALLAQLDPATVIEELEALTYPHEPVLLCWEVPPFDDDQNWCHRRLVADWLFKEARMKVDEYGPGMLLEIKLEGIEDQIELPWGFTWGRW